MRTIRLSITFNDQFNELLDFGDQHFGTELTDRKIALVYDTIERFLAVHPAAKQPHPTFGLRFYPVSRTPFVLVYDFNDAELRVHFIVHKSASLKDLDPASAQW